jgi:DNA-binding NarL/FixJ family response regulator
MTTAADTTVGGTGTGDVRVLLVDDQAPFLAAARAVVERTPGFVVVAEATGGAEAVEAVALHHPDLVVMDIRMPGVDGIAAARRIVSGGDPPVVVLVSTYDRDDLPDEVATSGAAAYLHKEELTASGLAALWAEHGPTLTA